MTFIIPGKNDNYCGNFIKRINTNINKLCDNIVKLRQENNYSILICDWGSPDSCKLSDSIEINHPHLVEFLHIPSSITDKISNFSGVHCWNAAFRRTLTPFVMFLEGDTYIPYESFKKIDELLSNGIIKCAWGSRIHIPYEVHIHCKSFIDLDLRIQEYNSNTETSWLHQKIDNKIFMGGATSLLIERNIYESSTGVWEKLTGWGWSDIEFHNRISTKFNFDHDLEYFGIIEYAQNHEIIGNDHLSDRKKNGINPQVNSPVFEANDTDWGLFNEKLQKYRK